MNFTEQQLINWSKPVSTTEDQKCKNAISQVTKALRDKFGDKITIFLQGSYRNNTNVRLSSDVDIVMRYDNAFFPDLQMLSDADKAIYNANRGYSDYSFDKLKADTENALIAVFGSDTKRKNKCIQVKGNSNRIDADVIPCFVLKRFETLDSIKAEGIKFYSDDSKEIISFPNQHYLNGTIKNEDTYRLYKRMVRILKVLYYKLVDSEEIEPDLVSSFFIECLVYNVPNEYFVLSNYTLTLRNVIGKIYEDMANNANYVEVSKLKWLFSESSTRKHKNALDFTLHCWNYLGY